MLQKILVVDDLRENILALSKLLRELQVEILTASNGNEALGLILEHPDLALILLDVQMPEMDGFEVAELIRGNEPTKHIPIIFVTAISKDREHVFQGYSSGAVDYLFKPIEPHVLLAKVRIFLELDSRTKALEETTANLQKEIEERTKAEAEKEKLIEELQAAIAKVKTLSGLLPICANCKKIRDDGGYWQQIESYIRQHSETEFTHSICPECVDLLYPQLNYNKLKKNIKDQ